MIKIHSQVLAEHLENSHHDMTPEEWSRFLLVMLPREYADLPLPESSTSHLPGTAAKRRIMSERIAAGYQPFHPDDMTIQGHQDVQRLDANGRNGKRSGIVEYHGTTNRE